MILPNCAPLSTEMMPSGSTGRASPKPAPPLSKTTTKSASLPSPSPRSSHLHSPSAKSLISCVKSPLPTPAKHSTPEISSKPSPPTAIRSSTTHRPKTKVHHTTFCTTCAKAIRDTPRPISPDYRRSSPPLLSSCSSEIFSILSILCPLPKSIRSTSSSSAITSRSIRHI